MLETMTLQRLIVETMLHVGGVSGQLQSALDA